MSSRIRISDAVAARRPWLIVQTGTTLASLRAREGDFAEWFRRGLRLAPERVECARVDQGAALPPAQGYAAAVITGSAAMASERLAWSERCAGWLRDAAATGLPLLGVCYGHQLLAQAFGGHVDYNPRGREIGSVAIHALPAAEEDALFRAGPARFVAHATHLQSVLRLPQGAVVLARSTQDECQAVRYAPRVWGLQFHPEFGVAQMRAYVRERADAITREAGDPRAILDGIRPSPLARALLRQFRRVVES